MALSGNGMGDEVTDAIIALSPGYGALSPAEQAQVRNYWKAICSAIVLHIKTNARLNFVAAEVLVDPGTFKDSLNAPITGQGTNATVTAKGTIT
jgi:hypothetical protein